MCHLSTSIWRAMKLSGGHVFMQLSRNKVFDFIFSRAKLTAASSIEPTHLIETRTFFEASDSKQLQLVKPIGIVFLFAHIKSRSTCNWQDPNKKANSPVDCDIWDSCLDYSYQTNARNRKQLDLPARVSLPSIWISLLMFQ